LTVNQSIPNITSSICSDPRPVILVLKHQILIGKVTSANIGIDVAFAALGVWVVLLISVKDIIRAGIIVASLPVSSKQLQD